MTNAPPDVFSGSALAPFVAFSLASGNAATAMRESLQGLGIGQLGRRDYMSPVQAVERVAARLAAAHGEPDAARMRTLAIAELALGLPQRVAALDLPESVLALYPRTLAMIASQVESHPGTAYASETDEAFLKDVHLTLALSVPCGAMAVEWYARLRLRSLVKHAVTRRDIHPLVRLARATLGFRWFRMHVDGRDLSDFNEAGCEACYRRIADLLVKNPGVAGMVGSSWFYDPQLVRISPRLAYLQQTPLQHGAIAIRHGPTEIDKQRATSKSETRRRLNQEGKYTPVGYTIAWPRQQLLHWAGRG